MYFSGQGKVFIAERDGNGNPLAFRYVGNVPDLKINLTTDKVEHMESVSGQRLTDLVFTKSQKVEAGFTLEDFSIPNLALAMYGTNDAMDAHSVTNEVLPDDLVAGDIVRLKYPNVSSVVITDSTGSPKTLTAGNYKVNGAYGSIQLNDLTTDGPYTQPFKVAYSAAATGSRSRMFGAAVTERWVRFEGLNTADGNKPVLVELYRVRLDPAKELALINDDLLKLELTGSALYDASKELDTELGVFGRVVLLT